MSFTGQIKDLLSGNALAVEVGGNISLNDAALADLGGLRFP